MSAPRPLVAAVGAFLASGVSVDPSVRARPPRPPIELAIPEAAPARPPVLGEATGPAPADVQVEVTPDGRGAHRVVVRRRGFLVSLRSEDARAAGRDWTAMRVSSAAGRGASAGRLVWETTGLDGRGLATERGLVTLRGDGASLTGELQRAASPELVTTWKSAHATCAGQHDGLGGFTALCRFAKGVRVSGAANVTGARSLDDVWLEPGPSPLVRLDLPRSRGGAEGRVIGLTSGATAIVLNVEASFPVGEEATLVFHASERVQPTP